MVDNDTDMDRAGTRPGSMGRYDPRTSGSYIPYIIGAVAVLAILYMFFGDSISNRTTMPTETTVPQSTTAPAPTAPATK